MNEAEWLSSDNQEARKHCLYEQAPRCWSERRRRLFDCRLRLFCLACARLVARHRPGVDLDRLQVSPGVPYGKEGQGVEDPFGDAYEWCRAYRAGGVDLSYG